MQDFPVLLLDILPFHQFSFAVIYQLLLFDRLIVNLLFLIIIFIQFHFWAFNTL